MHSPPRATPIISTHRRLPHSPSPRCRHPRQPHTTTDVIIIITPSPSPLPSPRTATTAAPGCYSTTTTTTIILKGCVRFSVSPKRGAVGFIKAPQRVLLVVKTSQKGAFGDALVEGMRLDLEMALRVRLVSWSAPSGAFGLSQHQGGVRLVVVSPQRGVCDNRLLGLLEVHWSPLHQVFHVMAIGINVYINIKEINEIIFLNDNIRDNARAVDRARDVGYVRALLTMSNRMMTSIESLVARLETTETRMCLWSAAPVRLRMMQSDRSRTHVLEARAQMILGGRRRPVQPARVCSYLDFVKCQPLNFKGTEGIVGLSQWIEKMESVFHTSGCAVENQVKFATCTLLGAALTRWNGHMRTFCHDVAYAVTWGTFKKKLTDKYCPNGEIKKFEIELWNLKVRGNDVAAYT
ncbi:hypothetical protein Tco_1021930 [Tanacetum coccineum]